jgi:hypothetical protein
MKALKGKDLGDGITWAGAVMRGGDEGKVFVDLKYT